MAATRFVSVTVELMNTIKNIQFRRARKFGVTLFKRKIWSFADWIEEAVKSWWKLALYLDTSNQNIWNRIVSAAKRIFPSEFEITIAIILKQSFASSSANNIQQYSPHPRRITANYCVVFVVIMKINHNLVYDIMMIMIINIIRFFIMICSIIIIIIITIIRITLTT